VTSLYRIHLCIQDGSTPSNRSSVCLAFNHRREVTPHPTMTEMLAVEDFVINSALYSQSNNRMTDDDQTFFIAGVGPMHQLCINHASIRPTYSVSVAMWSWRPGNLPSPRLHTVRPRIFIYTLSMVSITSNVH
jgi:hypothetical protein